uniref:G protein coupled receptor 4B n=1 Tax=Elephant endotheliotropic herpesvirus 1A TaxID=759753 RepID=A0A8B6NPZ5_ELHV1|nr:G protein coupled receptor 4B [Elephant endotheliotropic herpesvirus 1A]
MSNNTTSVSTTMSSAFNQTWGTYIMCLAGVGILTALVLFVLLVWFILRHKNYPNASIVPIQCCMLSGVIVYLYLIFVIDATTYLATPLFGLASVWICTCLTCHSYHFLAHPKRRNEDGMWSFVLLFFVVVAVQLLFGVAEIGFSYHDARTRDLFYFALFNMPLPILVLFFGSLAVCTTPARKGEEYTGNGLGSTILTCFVLWVLFFVLCMTGVFKDWQEVYKMLTIFTVYILYVCYAVTEIFTILTWLEKQEEEDKLSVKKVVNGILKVPLPFKTPPINFLMQPPPYEDKDPLLPV